jgi:hypothetical protein
MLLEDAYEHPNRNREEQEHRMKINGVSCSFHHLGIPTSEAKAGERFSETFGLYTSDSDCKNLRVQWHRFEPNSPLHPLIQSIPHVAFKVDDLGGAVAGCNLLLGPFEPIPGYRVAIIEDGGQPIELVQTELSDELLWDRAKKDGLSNQSGPVDPDHTLL